MDSYEFLKSQADEIKERQLDKMANRIAKELDRRALLHSSRGDRALTDSELEPIVAAIKEVEKGA